MTRVLLIALAAAGWLIPFRSWPAADPGWVLFVLAFHAVCMAPITALAATGQRGAWWTVGAMLAAYPSLLRMHAIASSSHDAQSPIAVIFIPFYGLGAAVLGALGGGGLGLMVARVRARRATSPAPPEPLPDTPGR